MSHEYVGTSANRRAVALDLDGILLDGMQFHIAAWHHAFSDVAVSLDDRDLYLLEGIKTDEVVDRLCEQHQLDLSGSCRARIVRAKKEKYRETFRPVPLAGAAELLKTCVESGYLVAIVTGTIADAATATLEALGMSESVRLVISAELKIPGKPDPAPFREATLRLGVDPDYCLAVDNAPAGIASATSAGLPCAGVATYLRKDDLRKADASFDDVQALAAWLREDYRRTNGVGPWAASLNAAIET